MLNKVISIATWLMLLILAGCSDASPYAEESSAQERTITLNLDITTRADNLPPDGSTPDMIRLWIFDGDGNFITRIVSYQNVWTPVESTDNEGNEIDIQTTLQAEIEAENIHGINKLKIYLVLNQPYEDSNTLVDFADVESIDDLKQKTFVLTEYGGDNKVPMTGEGEAALSVEGNKLVFSTLTPIKATRSVARLGIYCTKENPLSSSTLTINRITLSNVPDKGYLFEIPKNSQIDYSGTKSLLSEDMGIVNSYTGDMPAYSDDSWAEMAEESFVEVFSSYLLENPNGVVTDDGFLQVDGTVSDKRYCITLNYTLNGAIYTKKIYVSKIERNQYSKIYIRINDAITVDDICCQVNSWTTHEMEVPPFE